MSQLSSTIAKSYTRPTIPFLSLFAEELQSGFARHRGVSLGLLRLVDPFPAACYPTSFSTVQQLLTIKERL